jgi:tape measure domain-containing protein
MSDEQTKWLLELIDEVTPQAVKMARSLKALSKEVKALSMETRKLAQPEIRQWDSFFGSVKSGLKGVLSSVGDVIASYTKWIALAGVAAAGFGMKSLASEAIEAAAYKEKTMVSLGVFFKGDMDAAKKFYDQLIDFAARTPFSTKQAVDLGMLLKGAGFSNEKNAYGNSDISASMEGIGNLAAAMGKGEEGVQGILEQIRQIKALGKLTYADLKILGTYGLDIDGVYKQLAEQSGKSVDQAKKMVSQGEFTANQGLFAIFSVINNGYSGLMDKQADTLEGLWSTITSRPFELMMDVADTEGYSTMKDAFKSIRDGLDPKGEGARVKDALNALFDDALGFTFEGLAGKDGPHVVADMAVDLIKTIGATFNTIKSVFSWIGDYFSLKGGGSIGAGIIATFGELRAMFADLIEALGGLVEAIDFLIPDSAAKRARETFRAGGLAGVQQELYNQDALRVAGFDVDQEVTKELQKIQQREYGAQLAKALSDGYAQGLISEAQNIIGSGDIFKQAVDYVKTDILDSHSPSRVFYDLGLNTAKGFELGIGKGASGINNAMSGAIAPPSFEPSQQTGFGTQRANVTIGDIVIHANGSPNDIDKAEIKNRILDALGEAFQELGFEMGGTS